MLENSSPKLLNRSESSVELIFKDGKLENINNSSIFELIRDIKDPEHPYTLEQLNVVSLQDISISKITKQVACTKGQPIPTIDVIFTPTVPHCSLAGIIGLTIGWQLERHIKGYWIRIAIKEETHTNWKALNKQLLDRDRVLAAFENEDMQAIINECTAKLKIEQ